jgi:hypothetical protein
VQGINTENAREFQRKSVEARRRNKIAKTVATHEPDASAAIKEQIARVIAKLAATQSNKEIARLSLVLERLWNMVFPKAGSRKPGRDSQRKPLPVTSDDWQTVSPNVATQGNNASNAQ